MPNIDSIVRSKAEKERKQALLAIYGGLFDAVGHAGGVLTGFSVKLGDYDTLMTLRAVFPAGSQIAFVGAEDLPGALAKATREAGSDRLRWRSDRFGGQSEVGEEE